MNYNPHLVSRNERLAFRLKLDKPTVFWLKAKRRFKNKALQNHELVMHFPSIRREAFSVAKEFQGGDRSVKILSE